MVPSLALAAAAALLGAGCAPRPASTATPGQQPVARLDTPGAAQPQAGGQAQAGDQAAPLSATDPCAERLHALCGPLLYFYALNQRLPERIEELEALAGPDPAVGIDCPVSNLRYVYVPGGIPMPDGPGFVVLHDAEPSHAGFRWAVVVEEPKGPKQPLITRVVAVPEAKFPKQAPGAGAEGEGDAPRGAAPAQSR